MGKFKRSCLLVLSGLLFAALIFRLAYTEVGNQTINHKAEGLILILKNESSHNKVAILTHQVQHLQAREESPNPYLTGIASEACFYFQEQVGEQFKTAGFLIFHINQRLRLLLFPFHSHW